jgi:CelD/BcsL family acetyltransferase involved in cellulose biosynthesis
MSAVIPARVSAWRRRPAGTGTIVEIRHEIAALRALVPDWEALAGQAAEPNPFYEHWMLLPALEAYGTDAFRCVVVWENGTLAGLFPMHLERRFHTLPLPTLRSWRHRNMLLCGTPLVHAKYAVRCLRALLQTRLAPALELQWLPSDGPLYAALVDALRDANVSWFVADAYSRALLARDRDPRERFNSNMKNNLRRCQARLAAAGQVTPVRLSPGDDVTRWTDEFLRLEASGWKARVGSALACREDDRKFVAATFPEAFRRGRLVITGLDLDGRPLARHCMIAAGEGAFTFKIAYDEAYAQCSPGLVAEVDNVRQFMENPGPRWVDSNTARENTSYGRVWKDRRTFQRVAVGLRGRGRIAVAALPLARLAKHALGRGPGGSIAHGRSAAGGVLP